MAEVWVEVTSIEICSPVLLVVELGTPTLSKFRRGRDHIDFTRIYRPETNFEEQIPQAVVITDASCSFPESERNRCCCCEPLGRKPFKASTPTSAAFCGNRTSRKVNRRSSESALNAADNFSEVWFCNLIVCFPPVAFAVKQPSSLHQP